MKKMTGKDLMPFGQFKGKKMSELSGEYLLWLLNVKKVEGRVKTYIENNIKSIEKKAKAEAKAQKESDKKVK